MACADARIRRRIELTSTHRNQAAGRRGHAPGPTQEVISPMRHQPTATTTSRRSPTGSPTGGCAADATSSVAADVDGAARQRAVAYVRESTEEQGQGFSPDAQRESIRKFAAENDLELVGEYCDFHSGWRKSEARPEFQRLMADAAEGKLDIVLVYHTSRFARNQVEARRYKQLLRERLGVRVVSVTQPMGEDPSDPSAFLAESIHEMFDEYYSVSLSFWTRSGLREKARQGHLVGSLPWGYMRDPDNGKLVVPDPERAPLVLELFKRYATDQESDRTLAAWLNAKGALTARGRPFGRDTVREMLCNAAYAGYVTALRSKDRSIRGLHEAIVPEDLFDRVQQIRAYKARVKQPSPPSDEYLLRKMLRCERCGARMHGTRGSRPPVRRYLCSTRRHGEGCAQPITKAEPLENQLADWLRGFQPDAELRQLLLNTIAEHAHTQDDQTARRAELAEQLQRLRDVYVLGDLTKAQYTMRRQALQDELERLAPPTDPQLVEADRLLSNFERFWEAETSPAERHRLITSLFEQIWQDDGQIVAVKPRPSFVRYFQALAETPKNGSGNCGVNSGSDGGRLRTLRPIYARASRSGACRRGPQVRSAGGFCTHIPDHLHRLRGQAYQITEVRKLP
jgi:site-specific DNA recombinase